MTYATHEIERPYGRLLVLSPESERFPEKPLILLLHGAFEKHKKLLAFADLWRASYDVALSDLPGHGQSAAMAAVTFDGYIEELQWLVGSHFAHRSVVIVGDSFGGLLGIALGNHPPPNLAGVVALDPLLATAKQWSIQDLLPRILDGQPAESFRPLFAGNIMGMGASAPEDKRYHHFIEGVRVPSLVIAGAEALGVRREVVGPSLLDDDDRTFLDQRGLLKVIPGVGHQLVLQKPQETFSVAESFVRVIAAR